jgi:hypothetical protein
LIGYSDKGNEGENKPRNQIINCYATGSVSGESTVGGLVGQACVSQITNCFSTGNITSTNKGGGLIGYINCTSLIEKCFWDIDLSKINYSAGGTGRSTYDMKQKTTYTDWNFTGTWMMSPTTGYPCFLWQPVAVTAGGLNSLSSTLASIDTLRLTGTIDARDFKTMRGSMPDLKYIDLSGVSIVEYTGTEGTNGTASQTYAANAVPDFAFADKLKLVSVILPPSITTICYRAFKGCSLLTSVEYTGTVLSTIENQAFYLCTGLTSLFTLPGSLISIGDWAFQLTKIPALTIPASVKSLGGGVFTWCSTAVTVDPQSQYFASNNGVLYDKANTTLYYCPNSKTGNFAVPASVTTIADGAFANCTSLTTITLPQKVSTLGEYTFQYCTSLTMFVYNPTVVSVKTTSFHNASLAVYVPAGTKQAYTTTWGTSNKTFVEMDIATNPSNKALDFDGVNDYVKVPYSAANNTATFTAEAYFNCRQLPTNYGTIIASGPKNGNGFGVYVQSNGYYNFC